MLKMLNRYLPQAFKKEVLQEIHCNTTKVEPLQIIMLPSKTFLCRAIQVPLIYHKKALLKYTLQAEIRVLMWSKKIL